MPPRIVSLYQPCINSIDVLLFCYCCCCCCEACLNRFTSWMHHYTLHTHKQVWTKKISTHTVLFQQFRAQQVSSGRARLILFCTKKKNKFNICIKRTKNFLLLCINIFFVFHLERWVNFLCTPHFSLALAVISPLLFFSCILISSWKTENMNSGRLRQRNAHTETVLIEVTKVLVKFFHIYFTHLPAITFGETPFIRNGVTAKNQKWSNREIRLGSRSKNVALFADPKNFI